MDLRIEELMRMGQTFRGNQEREGRKRSVRSKATKEGDGH